MHDLTEREALVKGFTLGARIIIETCGRCSGNAAVFAGIAEIRLNVRGNE